MLENELFLMYDNGPQAAERLLVCSHPRLLQSLSTSLAWASDGTFKIVPYFFRQVYVIRCQLQLQNECTWITCIYAIMESKTGTAYENLFLQVSMLCMQYGKNMINPIFKDLS
jgi:hypothetical protein